MTVCLGVSGEAFCAVTTLPPPEQAAAYPQQLAGHRVTARPRSKNSLQRRTVAEADPLLSAQRLQPNTDAVLLGSE